MTNNNKQMSKNTIPNDRWKSVLDLFIGLLVYWVIGLFLINLQPTAFAAASPSAQQSPTASSSSTLLDKINEIKTKAASKAADFLSEVTKKLQNKAYIGVITSLDQEKITIKFDEDERVISTDEYTKVVFPGKTPKKLPVVSDIQTGDFVSALGDVDDKGVLKAKRIVKSSPIASESSKLVWGTIQKVQGGTLTLKLIDTTDQTVTASGQTSIFLGQEEASLLDLKSNRTVVVRGKESKDRILSASYIYIIPANPNVKPEKKPVTAITASPSATPRKK